MTWVGEAPQLILVKNANCLVFCLRVSMRVQICTLRMIRDKFFACAQPFRLGLLKFIELNVHERIPIIDRIASA